MSGSRKTGRRIRVVAAAVGALLMVAAALLLKACAFSDEGTEGGELASGAIGNADRTREYKEAESASESNASQLDAPAGSNSDNGSNGGGADKAPASQPSGTPSASQPSGNGGSSQGGTSQPEHVHNWVAQTERRWVQDSAAWDEQCPTGSYIQCSCGQRFDNQAQWSQHNKSLGFGQGHSYSVQETYGTVHHDATGHYETATVGYRCSCGAVK